MAGEKDLFEVVTVISPCKTCPWWDKLPRKVKGEKVGKLCKDLLGGKPKVKCQNAVVLQYEGDTLGKLFIDAVKRNDKHIIGAMRTVLRSVFIEGDKEETKK